MQQEKPNTNRIDKINSLLQQQLGRILLPYIEDSGALVTITKVETSRDLKWSKVWISILGGNDDEVLKIIRDNIYDIQGETNRYLHIKVLPRLQFFLDTSARYAAHINELIREVKEEE